MGGFSECSRAFSIGGTMGLLFHGFMFQFEWNYDHQWHQRERKTMSGMKIILETADDESQAIYSSTLYCSY